MLFEGYEMVMVGRLLASYEMIIGRLLAGYWNFLGACY